jgi:hypothetical protein
MLLIAAGGHLEFARLMKEANPACGFRGTQPIAIV